MVGDMRTKDQLRAAKHKPRYATANCPDFGAIEIVSLSRGQQRQWRNATRDDDAEQYADDVLIALSVVDDNRETVFTIEDALGGIFDDMLTGADARELIAQITDLNHWAAVTSKEVSAAVKNSKETPGNDSSGVSPADSE